MSDAIDKRLSEERAVDELHHITLRTAVPSAWLLVDLETNRVWRYDKHSETMKYVSRWDQKTETAEVVELPNISTTVLDKA